MSNCSSPEVAVAFDGALLTSANAHIFVFADGERVSPRCVRKRADTLPRTRRSAVRPGKSVRGGGALHEKR